MNKRFHHKPEKNNSHTLHSRHKTLNQCWFNVGPPSTELVKPTLSQCLESAGVFGAAASSNPPLQMGENHSYFNL